MSQSKNENQVDITKKARIYHISNKSAGNMSIYEHDEDKEEFLDRMLKVKNDFDYNCLTHAIMSNHLHLVLEAPRETITKLMTNLNKYYTHFYNKKYKRSGHTLERSYYIRELTDDIDCMNTIRYIHFNPVKHINLDPWDYKWTGFCTILNSQIDKGSKPASPKNMAYHQEIIDVKRALSVFGPNIIEAYKNFITFHQNSSSDKEAYDNCWHEYTAAFTKADKMQIGINYVDQKMMRLQRFKNKTINDSDRLFYMRNLSSNDRHLLIMDLYLLRGLRPQEIATIMLCSRQTIYRVLSDYKNNTQAPGLKLGAAPSHPHPSSRQGAAPSPDLASAPSPKPPAP